jgi:hypothetical protein
MGKREWTVETARWRQTSHIVAHDYWRTYMNELAVERDAGRVFGWTCIRWDDGVQVICTHRAER